MKGQRTVLQCCFLNVSQSSESMEIIMTYKISTLVTPDIIYPLDYEFYRFIFGKKIVYV